MPTTTILLAALQLATPSLLPLAAASNGRPHIQFLLTARLFGKTLMTTPINNPHLVSDTIGLYGDGYRGQRWQVTGDYSWMTLWGYLHLEKDHPHANLFGLLAPSKRASAQLQLADQAATREDHDWYWIYGGTVAGALPLTYAMASSPSSMTSNPGLYVGLGIWALTLIPTYLSIVDRQASWNHLERAVAIWNRGQ